MAHAHINGNVTLGKAIKAGWKVNGQKLEYVIEKGSKGHSYQKIFGPFLWSDINSIHLREPRAKQDVNLDNFPEFWRIVSNSCQNLTDFELITNHTENINERNYVGDLKYKLMCFLFWNGGETKKFIRFTEDESVHQKSILLKNQNGGKVEIVFDDSGLQFFLPRNQYPEITDENWKVLENRPCCNALLTCQIWDPTSIDNFVLDDHVISIIVNELPDEDKFAGIKINALHLGLGIPSLECRQLDLKSTFQQWDREQKFKVILNTYSRKNGSVRGMINALEMMGLHGVKFQVVEALLKTLKHE